jgi:Omp85 superfamily domain
MNFPQVPRDRFVLELIVLGTWLVLAPETSAQSYVEVPALRLDLVWHATGDAATDGYWVLKSLPNPEDVIATDPALNRDIRQAITTIRVEDATSPRVWNLKKRDPCNFSNELGKKMPAYPNLQLCPLAETDHGSRVFDLKVGYQARTAPLVARKPIEISIIVRGSEAIARQPVMTTIGNLAAHHVGNLGPLSSEDGQTKVFVGVTDALPPTTVAWADSKDHANAFQTAVFAFTSAKAHNLEANQPFGIESQEKGTLAGAEKPVDSEIESYVSREFGLPGDWRPVPSQDDGLNPVLSDFGAAPWRIRIALQAVEEVTFRIRGSRVEGNFETLEAHPGWASDIAALEHRVQEREKKFFGELRGRLLTNEEFLSLTEKIRREVELGNKVINAAVETGERSVTFTGDFLPRVTDLEAGVGYSTDKQLSGSLSLTTRNVLIDNSLLKLSATAGMEKQAGELSYTLPYFSSRDGRSSSTLDINATYGKDNDLLLGTPQIGGFDEEQLSGSIRNTFQFVKERLSEDASAAPTAPEMRPSRIYSLMVAASAGLSDTRLSAPMPLRDETESGQILFLLLDLQQNWRWKLKSREEAGLGETRLLWNVTAKKGFNFGPGDFDFFAAKTEITGRAYFGSKSSRDFILRLTAGGALVTGNSPIFEEFRIGGDTIVRGMEEGERIARGAFFDTVQFGVAVERLWPGGSQAMGFDLKNIYLSVFFDHALITRRGSRDPQDGESQNFEAIGASVEMALPGEKVSGSLEFGYAWSPQSIHEHGRVFTTVHLDF